MAVGGRVLLPPTPPPEHTPTDGRAAMKGECVKVCLGVFWVCLGVFWGTGGVFGGVLGDYGRVWGTVNVF